MLKFNFVSRFFSFVIFFIYFLIVNYKLYTNGHKKSKETRDET